MSELLIGRTLGFSGDPFLEGLEVAQVSERGGVLIEDGRIAAVGEALDLRRAHPRATVTDHGDRLILPGFVDAHVHYPQTAIIASWGKRLIDWLNAYTFPEEMRFADEDHARAVAKTFFDLMLANGTTSVASFCTIHPVSVAAFFEEAEARGMRTLAGKTCMDRNAPEGLQDSAASAYDDSRKLIETWHGRGRASYAITPRFSPTSTPEQLDALGALAALHPTCPIQTHLSEQTDEVAWVERLYPDARDYLDTYERAGLLRQGAMFGHAIWLTECERARLRETGASLIHCPTSNTFIGSGLFDTGAMKAEGQTVGLATDIGGGSSFSMLRTMAAAYEIGQLRGRPIHPAELIWLATEGSAAAMGQSGVIGRLAPGAEADILVLDLASTPAIAQRAARADDLWEALFPTIMMGDDRAVAEVRVMGKVVA